MEALEDNGVLALPRVAASTTRPRSLFSKKLDDVGKDASRRIRPAIYKVTLDPDQDRHRRVPLGTFNWHIDGAQDEVPTKATMLSARRPSEHGGRDRVRQHLRRLRRR